MPRIRISDQTGPEKKRVWRTRHSQVSIQHRLRLLACPKAIATIRNHDK